MDDDILNMLNAKPAKKRSGSNHSHSAKRYRNGEIKGFDYGQVPEEKKAEAGQAAEKEAAFANEITTGNWIAIKTASPANYIIPAIPRRRGL